MKISKKKIDAVGDVLEWIDGVSDEAKSIGLIVGLLMQLESEKERMGAYLCRWISDCGDPAVLQNMSSCGFDSTVSTLMKVMALRFKAEDKTNELAHLVNSVPRELVILEFFRRLPDRDRLLLGAFNSFLSAFNSQESQDEIRARICNYDPAKVPAELQFLVGVKYASECISAA